MGGITEIATSAPGLQLGAPEQGRPLAETLKLNGYSTAQFGKCHEVPVWQTSPMGPFDSGRPAAGFEYFYGFIGGETNQCYPAIYEGTTPVEPPKTPEEGYHFTEDMTDKAIAWVRQQKALMPDKPFFMYYAPGATHAPHHVPKEWSDKYKGRFDAGWDALREETFARQKELGVIPADAELTARPRGDPGVGRHARGAQAGPRPPDGGLRRVPRAHRPPRRPAPRRARRPRGCSTTRSSTTSSATTAPRRGHPQRHLQRDCMFNGAAEFETPEFMAAKIDEFGGPEAYNHYAVGWAHAMDTPYQWTKQVASHWGGTRNGTIVHWPNGFEGQGRDARTSSTTSSTSPPPSSTRRAARSRPS